MTEAAIRETVFAILRRTAPGSEPEQVGPEENLREELVIDSFDFLNVIIELHKQLGVEIPETDYGQLTTMAGLIRYLSAKALR